VLFVVALVLALFVLPSPWGIVAVVVAAVVEIGETGFWIWLSKRRHVQVGPETLIGARGEAVDEELVRVDGELWQARAPAALSPGERVRVVGRHELVLEVEPDPFEDPGART
jgi:membrane protein implicated in regulation of membrane protease activity